MSDAVGDGCVRSCTLSLAVMRCGVVRARGVCVGLGVCVYLRVRVGLDVLLGRGVRV